MTKIIANPLPGMPWEEKPKDLDGPFWRYSGNPVVRRKDIKGADKVYNSAVVPFNGTYAGVFRADHLDGYPKLHVGFSNDALHWDIDPEDIHFLDEKGAPAKPLLYAYDPRVVEIEGTFYVTWCNYFNGPTIGLAKTNDFKTFTQLENVYVPFNRNGVLFPRRINGNYMLLNRPSDNGHTPFGDIFLSQSPDLTYWGKHRLVMKTSHYWWKNTKLGPGPVPIETSEGWLMLYHGVSTTCRGYVYCMGGALLDIDNPSKVIHNCRNFLLSPEEPYETTGFVPNVIFPCATLHDSDSGRIAVYYGSADTCTGLAFGVVDEVIDFIKRFPEEPV